MALLSCTQTLAALLLHFIVLQAATTKERFSNTTLTRIVGGSTTTIDRHSYLVQIFVRTKFQCGGALLTPRYVVSAAHCFLEVETKTLTVLGGTTFLAQGGIRRSVVRASIPPEYNNVKRTMDVAVLKLNKPMQGDHIRMIQLCRVRLFSNELITIAGWGKTGEDEPIPSSQLRVVQLRLISPRQCIQAFGTGIITNTMFCAQSAGKDTCQGDSGGPVIYKEQMCGIVSWGVGCARPNFPGVYTNIKLVRKFILSNIN